MEALVAVESEVAWEEELQADWDAVQESEPPAASVHPAAEAIQ